MIAAGRLNKRVTFQVETKVEDTGGGYELTWADTLTVWGEFRPERGRERLQAGRLEAALGGVLRVRRSTDSLAITEAHRVLIDGLPYQIRSVADPNRAIREMTVEKGVGT